MTEPTAEYQAEQTTDAPAPSETPVADFLKRNPGAHLFDVLLFAMGTVPSAHVGELLGAFATIKGQPLTVSYELKELRSLESAPKT